MVVAKIPLPSLRELLPILISSLLNTNRTDVSSLAFHGGVFPQLCCSQKTAHFITIINEEASQTATEISHKPPFVFWLRNNDSTFANHDTKTRATANHRRLYIFLLTQLGVWIRNLALIRRRTLSGFSSDAAQANVPLRKGYFFVATPMQSYRWCWIIWRWKASL